MAKVPMTMNDIGEQVEAHGLTPLAVPAWSPIST